MPLWFGLDHKNLALGALGVSTGVALFSTYKWLSEKRKQQLRNVYESEKFLNEYLVFHYGSQKEVLRYGFGPKDSLHFPKRCAELCAKHWKSKSSEVSRAFDIGCAVGRSTFELAKHFDEVVGLDYSQNFVDTCNKLKTDGQLPYCVQDEGDLVTNLTAKVPADVAVQDRNRTRFMQGDACHLPTDLGQFGCILAANLIDRLHRPSDFLDSLADLVAPDGIVVITSPYTWLEQFTEKNQWLGGYKDKDNKPVTTFDTLKQRLGTSFDLVEETEMPFFIRETAHKNQWTVAHATVWRRKA